MKAIKGLEDRLYALDQMIASCSRLVNEQKELAQVLTSDFPREKQCVVSLLVFYLHYRFGIHPFYLCLHCWYCRCVISM